METIATFPDTQGVVVRIVSALRDLLDCSIDTLAASLPKCPRCGDAANTSRLWVFPQGIASEPDDTPISFERFTETQRAEAATKASTVLLLSPSLIYERCLSERKLATHMVREMAQIDLVVSTPFDHGNAIILVPRFSARIAGSRYFIMRKRDLEKVRDALERAGSRVRCVRLALAELDLDITEATKLELPCLRWHQRIWGARLTMVAVCTAALFLASYGVLASKVSQAVTDIESALEQLEPRAKVARLKLDEELEKLKAVSTVRTRAISEGSVVLTIADLTSLLPDGTFLTDLEIAGSHISMSGYSQAASLLIGSLQDSGAFSNVRFSSSVTKAVGYGGDRFSIIMERIHAR